jgi:hypothetical protein
VSGERLDRAFFFHCLKHTCFFFHRDNLSLLNVSWKFRINWYLEQL